MLKIGEFSKLTKTTVKGLRYYDRIGLLKPAVVDCYTSYRYYTQEQIETAQKILSLKATGLSCKKIQSILEDSVNADVVLALHKQELENIKRELEKQLKNLDLLINPPKKQNYFPVLEYIPEHTVYCSRSYVKNADCIMDFIKLTLSELKSSNPDVGISDPD